ncbi:hypothetical protein QYF36_004102 [Acer negundo]|nr:hypothetical protein QYF36_004102 [Acer negundo]
MGMASRSSSSLVRANQLLLMSKRRHVVGLCCIKPFNSIPSFKLMMTTNIKPKSSSVNYSRDNITLIPASNKSNNNEAQIIENSYENNRRSILKTLMINWLKIPMAVSLLFLMMMITRSRRNMAWALPGGGGHPLSSSTSQSMGDQKTTTNNTYIVVETPEFVRSLFTSSSNHDVEEDCSARKTLSYKDIIGIFCVYVAALIFELVLLSWLPNVDAMEFEKRIIKLQVGLNMDSLGFENCFNRIAQSAAGLSKPEMLQFGGFYKDMLRGKFS